MKPRLLEQRLSADSVARHEERRAKRGQRFIKFPVSWLDRIRTPRCRATHTVALHLLYLRFRKSWNSEPLTLANFSLGELGVTRELKRRALRELEDVGVIRVEKRTRKSPAIQFLID